MDSALKRDISMIQMRNYMDPKRSFLYLLYFIFSSISFLNNTCRFYKNPDKPGHVLHVGTVIEGPSEYKSGRLTNRERKQSIVEEILADKSIREYSKRKYLEIQKQNVYKKHGGNFKKRQMKPLRTTNKKIKALF
jgi:hypothetical protein